MRIPKLYDIRVETEYKEVLKVAKTRAIKEGVMVYINKWQSAVFVYVSNKEGASVHSFYTAGACDYVIC